jgi:MFS family permease
MGVAQVAVYMARPLTSYRLLGLGEGGRAVGLVAACFALLPLFLAVPLGRHADRRHGLRLLTVGCAVQMLACVLLWLARSAVTLGAASAVLGVGHLALALGSQAVIARESGEDRHDQHFGLLTVGVSAGQLVGPLLGGLLVGDTRGAALVSATGHAMLVAAAIAALAVACGIVAERSGGSPAPEADAVDARAVGLLAIVGTRGLSAGIFASVAVLSAADVFTAYMPVLGHQQGVDPSVVGGLLAVRAGASIASRVGIGTLVRKVGRRRLLAANAAAAAAALAAIGFVSSVPALFALAVVVGAGLGFGQPLSMAVVVQLVPASARATALAVRLTGNRLGQVAAPAAAGAIAGSGGTAPVFWMLGGMLLASAAAVRRLPQAKAEPARGGALPDAV